MEHRNEDDAHAKELLASAKKMEKEGIFW
jgi:hypothetical protein